MRSNFSFALVGLILISGTCGLHLHLQAVQYVDNLDQSNENYYFGTIDKASYFAAQSSFRQAHPEAQSCPPSLSYVNTSNSNQSCFACDKIQQGIDLNTAKVLFNIQTRQCETCATGKTTICDKLLAGTFFSSTSPTASTAPASSSSSTTSSTTKSSTTPSSTTSVTNNPATTNNTSNTTSSQNTTTNAASASGATTNTASTQSSTSSQSSSSTTDAVLSNNCPPERPLYNENTKLCDSCRAGFEFLGTKQQCVPIIYATDPNAKGILLTNLT